MNIRGVVPLDEDSLLREAMRATGLSDFGEDDWREPFQVYVRALDAEADLNLMGRIRTRSEILYLLEARLRIAETYKRHPEIEAEQIIQPIIIVGQGRSGTSFLHNILWANPDYGVLTYWEAMFPCPPPEAATYDSDPRIALADKLIGQYNRVTPEIVSKHEFAARLPQECTAIMAINFMAPTWLDCLGQAPTYQAYIAAQDMEPALRYHRRVLKLLQWKNPRRHWVLKDVKNLDYLETVMKVYPDSCIVWPHRDPVRALASGVSIIGSLQWARTDRPFSRGGYDYVTDPNLSAARFNAVIDQLQSGVVPGTRFYSVLYRDLIADPMGTVESLHRHFGIALSDAGRAGMMRYIVENPRSARPGHQFAAGSDDSIAVARQAYRRYQEYFAIPNE
ncbi:MAG TPA: sulfotransferase [Steroidobacteraceae bacterium]|nr:sulfotransferase [Steroidobacteraceae bacterium]